MTGRTSSGAGWGETTWEKRGGKTADYKQVCLFCLSEIWTGAFYHTKALDQDSGESRRPAAMGKPRACG